MKKKIVQVAIIMTIFSKTYIVIKRNLNEKMLWTFVNVFTLSWWFFFIYKSGHRNVLSKRHVWMSIFHIINFKKKKIHGHRGPGFFFNKKLILDYYFCLKCGPVFLYQIFIIVSSPSQGIYNCFINNKLINNTFRFSF